MVQDSSRIESFKRKIRYFQFNNSEWLTVGSWVIIVLGLCIALGLLLECLITLPNIASSTILAWAAVSVSIQIPLFILLLQQMLAEGDVSKQLLATTIRYREIPTIGLALSTLMAVSNSRGITLIAFVLFLLLNIYAIYISCTVIFNVERYDRANRLALKNQVKLAMTLAKREERSSNASDELSTKVKVSFIELDREPDEKIVDIRSPKTGVLEKIDEPRLLKIMSDQFLDLEPKVAETNATPSQSPRFALRVFTDRKVTMDKTLLLELRVPKSYDDKTIRDLKKSIEKVFKIEKDLKAGDKWLYQMLESIAVQLEKSLKDDDSYLLRRTLSLYEDLADSVDKFKDQFRHQALKSDEWGFSIDSEISQIEKTTYEVAKSIALKSVTEASISSFKVIEDFIVNGLYNTMSKRYVSGYSRYDALILSLLRTFIYPQSEHEDNHFSPSQLDIRDSLIRVLEEHHKMLHYSLKKDQFYSNWILERSANIMTLCLESIRHSSDPKIFERLMDILAYPLDNNRYTEAGQSVLRMIRCRIYIVGAYLVHTGRQDSPYAEVIYDLMKSWSERKLTETLVRCSTKEYDDKWHINTIDQPKDGTFHSVPPYDPSLLKLWAIVLLKRPHIPLNILSYGNDLKFKETLLFKGITNEKGKVVYDVIKSLNFGSPEKREALLKIVSEFIALRDSWEDSFLINSAIDDKEVQAFNAKVNESYVESSIVHKEFGIGESEKSETDKGYMQSGIRYVFDKEAFIKNWHVGYANDFMAQDLGRGIADNQDKYLFDKLLANPQILDDPSDITSTLRKTSKGKWMVISNQVSDWNLTSRMGAYLEEHGGSEDGLRVKGLRQTNQIHSLYSEKLKAGIYFVDESYKGKLYVKGNHSTEPVRTEVKEYSRNKWLMDGIIKQKPEWLTKLGDEDLQKKYLSKKVRLLAERIYKYEPPKNPTVFYLSIEDEE